MKRKTKNIIALFLLLLTVGAVRAQVDEKGVTSTGKEIDCFTITPEDRVVNEYGAIVTQPRLTRNGKIITDDCCPTLDETSLTDLVTCTSISMAAKIQKGSFKGGYLLVFSDENYQNRVDSVTASEADSIITAKATGLTCYTRYYFKLTLNGQCEYVWTDSTRDATLEKATFCTVANISSTAVSETDLSREHKYNGSVTQIDSVYDHQGNRYAVVQIGDQCWLKENMRATTSPKGVDLQQASSGATIYKPRFYDYTSNTFVTNLRDRGYLYNWAGAMDMTFTESNMPKGRDYPKHRGVCPYGWHLPTDGEWKILEKIYLTEANGATPISSSTLNNEDYRGKGAGKLAGGCMWNGTSNSGTSPSNYSYSERNIDGFSAFPVGYYEGDGTFKNAGSTANFWSATSNQTEYAWPRTVQCSQEGVRRPGGYKAYGRSVRCLRDPQYAVYPKVDSVSCTSMNITAQVIGLGTLTNRTVCAYTDESCTTGAICASNVNVNATNDTISATITGLSCNTRYYIKVTATDGTHPVEAVISDSTRDMTLEKATFCTVISALALSEGSSDLSREHLVEGSTTEIDSVYDHQGNRYAVVQIGNQCWLKENMRATTEPTAPTTSIIRNSGTSTTEKYAYYPGNNAANAARYGMLYNWLAAMNGENTLGARGICPAGWHVPTNAEWKTLADSAHVGVNTGYNAGKLAGGCEWKKSGASLTGPADYSYSERNITGFNALPAGGYNGTGFGTIGDGINFWSCNSTYYQSLNYDRSFVTQSTFNGSNGCSVRCMRDVPDTITFISNNVIDDTVKQAVDRGATVQLSANTFSRGVGFEFANWNTERTGCGTAYADEADITVTGNITLYAQWNTFCTVVTRNDANELGRSENRIDTVKDHQGNKYTVMTINGICVMKQNMRCTTLPTSGHLLTEKSSNSTTQSYYQKNVSFGDEGYLYNWHAALDKDDGYDVNKISKVTSLYRGICPDGWHIPTEADWNAMKEGYDAGQLAASSCNNPIWNNSSVTNAPGNSSDLDKNLTGFSALPVGYHSSGNGLSYVNQIGYFITYAPCGKGDNAEYVYNYHIAYNKNTLFKEKDFKRTKVSVRCMRNPQYAVNPVVDTLTCNTMNVSAQTIGLNTLTGGTINLYTNEDCTQGEIVGSTTVNSDNILANFTGLSCNTRYYIKVTATDGTHPVEAVISDSTRDMTLEKATFCTVASARALVEGSDLSSEHSYNGSTTQIDSVYDHEGNRYAVVQIGDQCWLKENMRATTSPSTGSRILMNVVISYSSKSACWHHNDSTTYSKYGVLYNWCAAVDTFYNDGQASHPELANATGHSSVKNWTCVLPAGNRRGVCPKGWHLPTDDEWTALTTSAGVGVESGGTGLGKLAGGCDWPENTTVATCPGNYTYAERNSTGFSALPVGSFNNVGFDNVGSFAYFWSATQHENDQSAAVYGRYLAPGSGYMLRNANVKANGYSVRCVRDYPTLSISSDKDNISDLKLCGGQNLTYTAEVLQADANITPTGYKWSVNNVDSTSVTNTLSCHYTVTGTYNVRCVAYYGDNDSLVATKTTKISAGVTTATLGFCEDYNAGSITVKSGNCISLTWVNNEDPTKTATTSGAANTVLNESATTPEGVYTVTGTNSDGCSITKTATLGKATSHPCTVTSLRAGTPLDGGKYANKEYGTGTRLDSVSDHQGNVYRVVQIDNQCWLAENMRATTSPSTGSTILMTMVSSFSSKCASYYEDNEATYGKYGVLYNWCAAVDTFFAVGNKPELANADGHISSDWSVRLSSRRRGICPEGWHVPTDDEWTTLTQKAGVSVCDSYVSCSGSYAGKLAGGCDWSGSGSTTTPNSYGYRDRNCTGFCALPAGCCNSGRSFDNVGSSANFWSSTPKENRYAYNRNLYYIYGYVSHHYSDRDNGLSVRCVRDNN